jgi:hypothetical protein
LFCSGPFEEDSNITYYKINSETSSSNSSIPKIIHEHIMLSEAALRKYTHNFTIRQNYWRVVSFEYNVREPKDQELRSDNILTGYKCFTITNIVVEDQSRAA